jgi:hypothetical protein
LFVFPAPAKLPLQAMHFSREAADTFCKALLAESADEDKARGSGIVEPACYEKELRCC